MTATIPSGAAMLGAKTPEAMVAMLNQSVCGHAAENPALLPEGPPVPPTPSFPSKEWRREPITHRLIFTPHEETRQNGKNPICATYPKTDLGNCERFVMRYGLNCRYSQPFKSWYVWDHHRWQQDQTGIIKEFAKETVIRIGDEAACVDGATGQSDLYRWAAASQAKNKIDSLVDLAKSTLSISPDQLDTHHALLNCQNGTLDLTTGEFTKPRRDDLITKIAGCSYDPAANCPTWDRFLNQIMAGNKNLVGFLQRATGYSLSGFTGERAFFLCHGAGANGKSTFLNTLLAIMGDYGHTVEPDTYCVSRSDSVRNDLAGLKGVRFAVSTESRKGKRLDESIVKQLTGGGDRIRARFLFQESFEFQPECKIWWAFNSTPRITDSTESIWSRVRMIPFTVTIKESDRDIRLPEKLRNEAPGILNWMLAGYKEYQRIGLAEPEEVRVATAEYRENEDTFADFISLMCNLDPTLSCESSSLYEAYRKWMGWEAPDEDIISQRKFGFEMNDRGFKRDKDSATGRKIYHGIRPKNGGF